MRDDAWKKLELTLTFKADETQALVEALAHLPFHLSAKFINAIQNQTAPQVMEFELKIAKGKQEESV
jgi:hypothetical protein